MIKITIMAPRTTIQLGTWTPAIDVFRLNHSMPCLPDLNAGSPKTRRTAWRSTSRGFCRDGLGLRHWSQPAHVRYGNASAHIRLSLQGRRMELALGPKSAYSDRGALRSAIGHGKEVERSPL